MQRWAALFHRATRSCKESAPSQILRRPEGPRVAGQTQPLPRPVSVAKHCTLRPCSQVADWPPFSSPPLPHTSRSPLRAGKRSILGEEAPVRYPASSCHTYLHHLCIPARLSGLGNIGNLLRLCSSFYGHGKQVLHVASNSRCWVS